MFFKFLLLHLNDNLDFHTPISLDLQFLLSFFTLYHHQRCAQGISCIKMFLDGRMTQELAVLWANKSDLRSSSTEGVFLENFGIFFEKVVLRSAIKVDFKCPNFFPDTLSESSKNGFKRFYVFSPLNSRYLKFLR